MCKLVSIVGIIPPALAAVIASAVFAPAALAQTSVDPQQVNPDQPAPGSLGLRAGTQIETMPVTASVPVEPPPPPPLPNVAVTEPGQVPNSYSAVGLRRGAFVFYPTVETGYKYTDNVLQTSTNKMAAHGLTIAPGLRIQSNWSRHSLRASLQGEYILYNKKASPDHQEYDVSVDGRIDIRHGTTIDLSFGLAKASDPGGANQAIGGAEISDETSYRASSVFTHKFNRLSFALRGGFETQEYSDVELSGGGTQTNGDRDYTEYDLGLRTSYEFSPVLTGFVATNFQPRRYKQKVDDNGLQRNSNGYEVLFGGVINYDALWKGEAAVGYAWRRFVDPSFENAGALVFKTALTWQPSRITKVSFKLDSEIEETSVSTAAAVNSYTAGVRVDHAFREHLTGFGAVDFTLRDFLGSAQQEQVWKLSSGFEYFLNRSVSLLGIYDHERLNTNQTSGDYTVNTVSLKVKVKR